MRLLITGATGFVGASLACYFATHHHQVHILIRPDSNPWRLKGYLDRLHRHFVDLRQPRHLKQIVSTLKPQVIIHTAAAGIYRNRHASPTTMIDTNFKGTVNLIQASENIPYQAFIHTGSSVESNPQDIYAITKLAATQFAQTTARKLTKPIVTLRLFSPYGPLDDPRRLIPYAITQALSHQPLKLANPQAVRDFIFIGDVVAAYAAAINQANRYPGEIFNIGSGKQTTVQSIVTNIRSLTHSQSQINWHQAQASHQDIPHWQADITQTKRLLHWQPKTALTTGLKQTVRYLSLVS